MSIQYTLSCLPVNQKCFKKVAAYLLKFYQWRIFSLIFLSQIKSSPFLFSQDGYWMNTQWFITKKGRVYEETNNLVGALQQQLSLRKKTEFRQKQKAKSFKKENGLASLQSGKFVSQSKTKKKICVSLCLPLTQIRWWMHTHHITCLSNY